MTLNQQKIENYVIIASLKSETIRKLIYRIPGLHLLISSLPGLALRMHVESLGKPPNVNRPSQSLALDQDQAQHFVRPDLDPNCLQRLSADDTGR